MFDTARALIRSVTPDGGQARGNCLADGRWPRAVAATIGRQTSAISTAVGPVSRGTRRICLLRAARSAI